MLCTTEAIKDYMKAQVSDKRYRHCEAVAWTMERLFERYGYEGHTDISYNCLSVSDVVGLMHDCFREYTDAGILAYSEEHDLPLTGLMRKVPMLGHGMLAADFVKSAIGAVPESWLDAMIWHTTGSLQMGYFGMVLLIADFIEPTRTFLDDEKRKSYLEHDDINDVASEILDDMISHWRSKNINPSIDSLSLQRFYHDGNKIK